MEAKKIALFSALALSFILLIDFFSRLTLDESDGGAKKSLEQVAVVEQAKPASILSVEAVEELLAWSDVKPSPAEIAKAQAEAAQAAANTPPPPPPPPKVDVHQQVAQAIAGDDSKSLIGDNLFTLKGVFYDKSNFAVLEVENIVTKQKRYFRAGLNENVESHQIVDIGKHHVLIKNGDQDIRLQMFEGTL